MPPPEDEPQLGVTGKAKRKKRQTLRLTAIDEKTMAGGPRWMGTRLKGRGAAWAGAAAALLLAVVVWGLSATSDDDVTQGEAAQAVVQETARAEQPAAATPPLETRPNGPGTRQPPAAAPQSAKTRSADKAQARKRTPPPAPKPATLVVNVSPSVEVFVGKTSYGFTPLDAPINLPPGKHVVRLLNPQLGIAHREVMRLGSGGKQKLHKRFVRGELLVFVKPFGEVYINGAHRGLTPLDAPLALYEGNHKVRVVCEKTGKSDTRNVRVRGGEAVRLNFDLR